MLSRAKKGKVNKVTITPTLFLTPGNMLESLQAACLDSWTSAEWNIIM